MHPGCDAANAYKRLTAGEEHTMRYTGTAVSAGVVIGKVYLYERFVSDVSKCPMGTPAEEAAHYLAARDAA